VLKVEHIPHLHDTILSSATNQVILVKDVVLVLLLGWMKFIRGNVFEIYGAKFVKRLVTGLQLDSDALDEVTKPD